MGVFRFALCIAALLVFTPQMSFAQNEPFVSKKERYLQTKKMNSAQVAPQAQKEPKKIVNLYNFWTHEYLPVIEGEAVPPEQLSRYFRCRYTNREKSIAQTLFPALLRAAAHFKVTRINIVSGYRSEKYNLMLRKKGREVGRNSHHTLGDAIDFKLPTIPTKTLYRWVLRQRLGGVGYYPVSGFVHMDTGKRRTWRGR